MAKTKKTPELRFTGFTEEWEERKLGSIAEFNPKSSIPEVFEYVDLESVVGTELITHRQEHKYSAPSRAQRLAKNGDLFYQMVRPYQKNNYLFLKTYDDYVFSTGYAQLRPAGNGNYLLCLVQTDSFVKLVIDRCTGTSYPAINSNDLADIETYICLRIKEQSQIGSFFQNIDALIALHQRKHDKLLAVKKAMLEKMFPKEGADVPEIRFKGFTGKWERKTFRDNIISIQTGTNLLGSINNAGMPLIKMGNIQRGYFSFERIEYLDVNAEAEKENMVNYGDFLFNTRNTLELVGKGATWLGKSGKYAFNSNIARFVFQSIDTVFFNYLYNTRNMIKQVQARAMGTTSVAAVYPHSLNSVEYRLPSIDEQKEIGTFLLKIDSLISLQQRELDKLKNIKKACLEKMFV